MDYAYRTDTGWHIVRCDVCFKENYAPAVASGSCAWCGWEPSWTTYTGKSINLIDLTDEHIINILKFFMAQNTLPGWMLLEEARYRKLIQKIAIFIPEQEGYKSPDKISESVK